MRDPLLRRASRDTLALPSPQLVPQPSPLVGTTLPARAGLPWLRPTRQNTIPTLPEAHAWVPRATHRLASFGTCFSEERQGRRAFTRASISCIHDGIRTGSQTTGPSSRPGSVAYPHTGTGLNFPGDCSPSRQADGCSFLRMEPGRLLVPEPGAEWARAVGCGVWQAGSHSRCSWLDQEPSSVRRDPGPNSTERTLSANLREYKVSLVFFSTGDTCTTMRVLLSPLRESCSR